MRRKSKLLVGIIAVLFIVGSIFSFHLATRPPSPKPGECPTTTYQGEVTTLLKKWREAGRKAFDANAEHIMRCIGFYRITWQKMGLAQYEIILLKNALADGGLL